MCLAWYILLQYHCFAGNGHWRPLTLANQIRFDTYRDSSNIPHSFDQILTELHSLLTELVTGVSIPRNLIPDALWEVSVIFVRSLSHSNYDQYIL